MKWQGRQGSDNVEDRRGMSPKGMAVGGGIGTIVIVLLVLLLGGDMHQVILNREILLMQVFDDKNSSDTINTPDTSVFE